MPITSEVFRGLIYAGVTPLACTIAVEQTGLLTLTVRAGSFTTTGDRRAGVAPETVVLDADHVVTITPDAVAAKAYQLDLGVDSTGAVEILARSRVRPDRFPDEPPGWRAVHPIVFEFLVPPLTTDLADLTLHALRVLPGFPEGTTAEDWERQEITP